jgi:hypothetical protein
MFEFNPYTMEVTRTVLRLTYLIGVRVCQLVSCVMNYYFLLTIKDKIYTKYCTLHTP